MLVACSRLSPVEFLRAVSFVASLSCGIISSAGFFIIIPVALQQINQEVCGVWGLHMRRKGGSVCQYQMPIISL